MTVRWEARERRGTGLARDREVDVGIASIDRKKPPGAARGDPSGWPARIAAIRRAPLSGAVETLESNGDLQITVVGRATSEIPALVVQLAFFNQMKCNLKNGL